MTHLLVDGNNLAARSNHQPSLSQLTADDGTKTGAIFGFLKGLAYVMHKVGVEPRETTVVWDGGHSEDRIKLYPDYKANRKPTTLEEEEDSLSYRYQLTVIRDLLTCRPFHQVLVGGVEADDTISVLAQILKKQTRCVIFSGDQDFWQLYSTNVLVFDPKRGVVTPADITAKTGVPVADLVLWKCLVGDASDNIKGVWQVGPKRAVAACKYLRALNTNVKLKPGVTASDWEGEKNAKHISRVMEKANRDVVSRNIKLMRLPLTFDASFLSDTQAEDAMTQWLTPGVSNTRKFLNGLSRFNIESFNMSSW